MSKVERLRQRPGRVVQHHALKRETQQGRRAFTDEHEARLTALRWLHRHNTIRCRSRLGQQPPITHDHRQATSTTVARRMNAVPKIPGQGPTPNTHPAQKPQPAHHSPRPLPARPIQEPQTRPPTTARLPNAKAHPTARPEATVSPPVADLVERHGRVDGQIKATPQRAHPNPPAAEAITGPPVTKRRQPAGTEMPSRAAIMCTGPEISGEIRATGQDHSGLMPTTPSAAQIPDGAAKRGEVDPKRLVKIEPPQHPP